ncbi:hypothetical protein [Priestia aryabhattai]|uniref:hypothetical protein n=1 Tax=Priestia aryabhattai TaxID=412384 RepID=UPI000652B61D|nr:hypothetical protein [Priestia aryabhattai]KMN92417.1 hypothetical protein ABV89_27450 [Priestia aryabhattai]
MSFQFSKEEAKIPLVIGVTGHRDLRVQDKLKLKEGIKSFLKRLQSQYPNTPFIILSPLAEGADTLVAQAALELKEGENIKLIVPLPFEKDKYENTFTDGSSHKKVFEDLLDVADDYFVNPIYKKFLSDNGQYDDYSQDKYYAMLGNYIAKNCHILLALWNGVDNQEVGGTAHVVKSKLYGNTSSETQSPPLTYENKSHTPLEEALDIHDTGIVYWLVTPRNKTALVLGEPFSIKCNYPSYRSHTDREVERLFNDTFKSIDNYNKQLIKLNRIDSNNSSREFLNILHNNGIIEAFKIEAITPSLQTLLHKYFGADNLATYYMKKRRSTLTILAILGILSLAFFSIYGNYSYKWALLSYTVLFTFSCAYYLRRKKSADNYSLDYRALAEGLRIQFFCRFIGLTKNLSDQYLRQRNELQWISYSIQSCNLDTQISKTPSFSISSLKMVLTFFITSQINYFEKKIEKHKKMRKKFNVAIILGFTIAAICVGIIILEEFSGLRFGFKINITHLNTVASVLIITSVGLKALFDKESYDPSTKAYQHMLVIYQEAYEHLSQLLDNINVLQQAINKKNNAETTEALIENLVQQQQAYEEKIQEFIFNLGVESLKENAWWAILHRDKKAEVVKG